MEEFGSQEDHYQEENTSKQMKIVDSDMDQTDYTKYTGTDAKSILEQEQEEDSDLLDFWYLETESGELENYGSNEEIFTTLSEIRSELDQMEEWIV